MIDRFTRARAQERRVRMVSYLPHPDAVEIVSRVPRFRFLAKARLMLWLALGSGVRRWAVCHFTERQRLELAFVGNAIVYGDEAGADAVYQFLWRLSPHFIRPNGEMPNRRFPGQAPVFAGIADRVRSAFASYRLSVLVESARIEGLAETCRRIVESSEQDKTGSSSGVSGRVRQSRRTPESCAWDDLCDYFGREYGMGIDEVMDRPRAMLFQLHRNRVLAMPDGELSVFNRSDTL